MNWLEKFKKFDIKSHRPLLWSFAALGAIALLLQVLTPGQPEAPKDSETPATFDVDTVIPAGFILIPIELSNAEALSSLTGAFAMIDLHTKGVKVASSVKLLRAPLNPEQFAVLVPEETSKSVLSSEGPFFAVLKNRSQNRNFVNAHKKPQRRAIVYGE